MAEGNDENGSPNSSKDELNSPSHNDLAADNSAIPDLGIENIRRLDKRSQSAQNTSSATNETPKREENPFSFKHFLNRDSSNYQSQGARPKIYTTTHSSSVLDRDIVTENHQPRIPPEYPSVLPDFVQDHLVIEQCYLGNDSSPQQLAAVDFGNLPDFTPNRNASRWNEGDRVSERNRNTNTPTNLPLDLPTRPRVGFPLDLPIPESQPRGARSCPITGEVGVSKSLPDFLSDGAVYSQPEDSNAVEQSPERETDQLRRELELTRRQLAEQQRRSDHLQRQLDASRDKEHEYTHNLTKAMEQVEENLSISNRRAVMAESTIIKLKQEIKQLTNEIAQLQKENRQLGCEEGAAGGASYVPNIDSQMQRFAQELKTAASTAEHSLRQLLGGVDNLRLMASSIENMYRNEERTESYLSDLDENTGPAL